MLTFGQGLYNLTQRDESTLYVDSFFRNATLTAAAAAFNASVDISIPNDRSLFISQVSLVFSPSALSKWNYGQIVLLSSAGTIYNLANWIGNPLIGDNTASTAAGDSITINRSLQCLLPPNTSAIRFVAGRDVTTNPASATMHISGYLIPPGGIGRLA